MRKILVTGAAVLFTAVAFAASSVPASAGNFNFTLGLGGFGPGWGPGWGPGYGGGGIIVAQPYMGNNWQAHVNLCYALYPNSYNPATNTYVNNSGKVKFCHTQFGY